MDFRCFSWLFKSILKGICHRYAYIFVAIIGEGFVPSACKSFQLFAKYPVQAHALEAQEAVQKGLKRRERHMISMDFKLISSGFWWL